MNKKTLCLVMVTTLIVLLSGCGKENKINEYDKENKIQVLADKEIIMDADYSEGNVVVPYINIDSSEVDEINNFLKDKAEELRSYDVLEIDGEKTFIHSSNYTYYLDEQILSVLFVENSLEGDGCSWYYPYNIDLENNKVLTTEQIISKLVDEEKNKELDKKVLDELNKKLANEIVDEDYRESCKEKAVKEYIDALQTFDMSVYVKEENKLAFVIPINVPYQYDLIVDMDIKLSDLFR